MFSLIFSSSNWSIEVDYSGCSLHQKMCFLFFHIYFICVVLLLENLVLVEIHNKLETCIMGAMWFMLFFFFSFFFKFWFGHPSLAFLS